MPKKKIKNIICDKFDFTSQNYYNDLIKLINKHCDKEKQQEIIDKLDKFIDYIYMYW